MDTESISTKNSIGFASFEADSQYDMIPLPVPSVSTVSQVSCENILHPFLAEFSNECGFQTQRLLSVSKQRISNLHYHYDCKNQENLSQVTWKANSFGLPFFHKVLILLRVATDKVALRKKVSVFEAIELM